MVFTLVFLYFILYYILLKATYCKATYNQQMAVQLADD